MKAKGYWDASPEYVKGCFKANPYPKSNKREGNETVNSAIFNDFVSNGFFKIACGTDTSEVFEINPHIYNKLISLQSMFLGFQRCGGNSWSHQACHTKDGSGLESKYEGLLKGGWHDCGDHLKVGQNTGYASMMLSFMSVMGKGKLLDMFSGDYSDTKFTDGIPDVLMEAWHGNKYIMNLYTVSKAEGLLDNDKMITGIGSFHDHNYWDLPSLQDSESKENGGADRKIHQNASSDVLGGFAASLALFSTQWRAFDKEYADSCLAAAEEIYEVAKSINKSAWDFEGLYSGDGYFVDEMAMAAVALAYAEKEVGNFEKSNKYVDDLMYNEALGSHNKADIDVTNTYTFL